MPHYKLKTDKLKRGDKRSEDNSPHTPGAKAGQRAGQRPDFRKGSPAKREAEQRFNNARQESGTTGRDAGRDFAPSSNRPQGNHATRKIARFTEQTRRGFGPRGAARDAAPEPAAFPSTKGRRVRETPAARQPVRERPSVREAALPGIGKNSGFAALMRETAREMGLSGKLMPEPSPLAGLDYSKELELKNATLRKFWALNQMPDKPNLVLPSPNPRHYRSTSKRRLIFKGTRWNWDFFSERPAEEATKRTKAEEDWSLESEKHQAVYRKALDKLREAPYQGLARSLNFLIVRGDAELMVLFNVHNMTAEVVRKAKMLAEHLLQDPTTGVVAAHLFFDPSKSSYYLEARGPVHAQRLKRLVGPEFLPIDVSGRRYFLHPLGFFQVNTSILPRVLEEVQRGLKPGKTERLLDLYCGCGFFTLPLEEDCKEAVGVEFSPVSLDAAHMAAGRSRAKSVRFVAGKIETAKLHRLIPPVDATPEILLLDPPVQGTAPGLIRALAERKPKRIAHLFCGMDVLPTEVKAWRKQGYMLAKAIPFDMFPGTDNLEVLVILIPDKYGILNRKKIKVDPVDEYEASQATETIAAPASAKYTHVKPVYRNGREPKSVQKGSERTSRKAPGRPRRKN